MLLAIDIGNTNISLGIFQGARLVKRLDIPTARYTRSRLSVALGKAAISDAIICSVVPDKTIILRRDLRQLLGNTPYIIGKEIKVPIKNLYRKPSQVGQDRLVNAYAGIMLYGAPLIILDFGTAVTFDLVSKGREYLGGLILPGLKISLDALAGRTALLPKIKLTAPKEFIGRDTKSSINSGIVYGFAALSDGLITRIRGEIGTNAKAIATGGNAPLIKKYCRGINRIDKDLTLKGLNLTYSFFKKNS